MNKLFGRDAIEYAKTHGVPLNKFNKYADPTEEAKEGISGEEAEEIASEDPGLLWCTVRETMVPVPITEYIAMSQFTTTGTNCPTPEFKHGQVVLDTKTWSRGKISSITLDAQKDFQYKVIFFGQTQEYSVESELLLAAGDAPHPREICFPIGTKVVFEEVNRLGSFVNPGVVRKIRYDEKEGVWEHLVQFLNCTKWVDYELVLWDPEKFENTWITEEDFKFFESTPVDACTS